MLDLLSSFIGELRTVGLPVSLSETVDAARALESIDVADRTLFRAALCATLVKSSDHLSAFDTAYEVFFANRRLEIEADAPDGVAGRDGSAPDAPDAPARSTAQLTEQLLQALRQNDLRALRQGAAEAVARFAGIEPGRPVGGAYYLYRTMRQLDLEALEQRLMGMSLGDESDALEERLARDDAHQRIEGFTAMVETEIRERLVQDRGAEAMAESVRETLPEDVDVMHANREEMAQLERALRPLSRKLAVRLARRRRRRHRGPIDLRHTVRSSLSTGGVPIDVRFKPPRPAKPEIVVIADVSGSVASFARFTLHLVHAIASQFSQVRSFVFVDGLDEVTHLFAESQDPARAVERIGAEANVVAVDGHSDYGRALGIFAQRYAPELTRRSTVLILGDARNNYHPAQAPVLADIRSRVKALYWLNPEPRSYWNSGDSVLALYAAHCDDVVECRTLRQLETFVGGLS
ncbi:MAG: VWA domain-containing protein [Acidobacteria bacterium]|nr:VWA domain-containing protein [Acidobacteriota bacterium]